MKEQHHSTTARLLMGQLPELPDEQTFDLSVCGIELESGQKACEIVIRERQGDLLHVFTVRAPTASAMDSLIDCLTAARQDVWGAR